MDCSGLNHKKMLQIIDANYKFYEGPKPKSVRVTTDFIDTVLTRQLFKAFEDLDKTAEYDLKIAVVGLNKAKRLFLNILNRFNKNDVKGFDTRKEAIKWLTK